MAQSIDKEGKVSWANQYGFKLDGKPDLYDYSRQNEVEHTTVGAFVRVKVTPKADGKWWVNQLEHVTGGEQVSNGHTTDYAAADQTRQASIIRQSCLKAAVEFYGTVNHTPDACGKGSEHVLALAERFEKWVTR